MANAGRSLINACLSGNEEDLVDSLDNGANPNIRDSGGSTPLHLACEKGFSTGVHLLLDAGADVNATDRLGKSALHIVCEHGKIACLKLLLEKEPEWDIRDDTGKMPIDIAHTRFRMSPNPDSMEFFRILSIYMHEYMFGDDDM